MNLRVEYDERAIGQATAFLDDPQGLREVLDAIDRKADNARPAGSFPCGSWISQGIGPAQACRSSILAITE